MPRGQRRRGAFELKVWFEDGASVKITSHQSRVHTNADLKRLLTEYVGQLFGESQAVAAVDPVDGTGQEGPTRV